jgi:hypothetical protein
MTEILTGSRHQILVALPRKHGQQVQDIEQQILV